MTERNKVAHGFTLSERLRFHRAALDHALSEADGAKTEEQQERWLAVAAEHSRLCVETETAIKEKEANRRSLTAFEKQLLSLKAKGAGDGD